MGFISYFQELFIYHCVKIKTKQNKNKTKQILGFITSCFFKSLNDIKSEWIKIKTKLCLQPNNQKPRVRKMEHLYIKLTCSAISLGEMMIKSVLIKPL